MGIERERAIFYNDCFADAAMLLIVCTKPGRTERAEYYEAARVYRPSAQRIIRIRCNAAKPEEKEKEQVISRCKIVTKRD
jgi:hypothetical protein